MNKLRHSKQSIVDRWTRAGLLQQCQSQSLYDEITELLDDKPFTPIVFPKLRRVFPTLVGQQIVSVQPMAKPSGMVYYPEYVGGKNLYEEIIDLADGL